MSTRFHQQALAEVSQSIKMEKEMEAAYKAEADALLRWVQDKLLDENKFEKYHVAWRSEASEGSALMLSLRVDSCCCFSCKPHYQAVWEITMDDNIWTVKDMRPWEMIKTRTRHMPHGAMAAGALPGELGSDGPSYSSYSSTVVENKERKEHLADLRALANQLAVLWSQEREKHGRCNATQCHLDHP